MKVVIAFNKFEGDIIDIPNLQIENLKKYERGFDRWIHNRRIDHGYWVRDGGRILYVEFGTEAFVQWLNTFVFDNQDEKAKILEIAVKFDKAWPRLEF